jgi:hypothetical protein
VQIYRAIFNEAQQVSVGFDVGQVVCPHFFKRKVGPVVAALKLL